MHARAHTHTHTHTHTQTHTQEQPTRSPTPSHTPLLPSPPQTTQPQDQDGKELGVAGALRRLSDKALSSQPVNSFDWSPDRRGLFVCSSFDQCVRVGVVTKLEKV
jgi:hypothetical protein